MDIVMIVLRLVHIGSAVFWGGSTFFIVSFLTPAVQAAGPEGGKVMQRLALSSFPKVVPALGGLTVLAGLLMYWKDSGGLQLNWITTPTGLGFTFGGLMGLTSLIIGVAVTAPAINRMAAIAREAMASGKPPSPEQMKEIPALQVKMTSAAVWTAIFLALAVLGMATARYL
jgi:uncharacterized membrane protein